ncbi:hypothetical protein B4O97_09640 [Marispirochaeta aestuarii]|uniref:HemY N-terminal domain-containing protein n=1 Tax=Marispirochaeta aestuarii TaxID=1963862 RepID=A0A1Y1RYF8_9SPIO|nr:hypothetical protein [Marispirochaeta aestuarii]ORC35422.1 hypothetical protein B4O97_09640 [Marispirochaeta aestuarii]
MKFKVIFILFNVVILFSFLIIFFMPLAVLGWEYTKEFWADNWYLPLVFFLIMGILNVYFIRNWRLFSLLEREEWGGIIGYVLSRLEEGRVRRQEVRMAINAALISSRLNVIGRIEELLRDKRPAAMPSFALSLGIPYLLNNDPPGAENYFREFLEIRGEDRPWIVWCYGFALLLQRRLEEAKIQFLSLTEEKSPILNLLTAYMLDTCAVQDEEAKRYQNTLVAGLRSKYTRTEFLRIAEKARTAVHIVVLGTVLDEAVEWLYYLDTSDDEDSDIGGSLKTENGEK